MTRTIKLRDALRTKITSLEQLLGIINTVLERTPSSAVTRDTFMDYGVCDYYFSSAQTVHVDEVECGSNRRMDANNFWWYREEARVATGVYPQRTDTMDAIIGNLRLQGFCLHPSTDTDTPEAVAYTPDATFGAADRQLKLSSLGKFLRKFAPLFTDAHIQALEAAHRAELDPTFQLATTQDEVERVYRNMSGDSGCMRYEHDRWGLPKGMHPSHVYASPNVGVAYHEVNGVIKSRAVVWTTPQGGKHWLRIYGDNALRRKLERNGYTEASLVGVKLRAIVQDDKILMPYIDGVGGAQGNTDGTYGYIDASEPDFVRLVDNSTCMRLRTAGFQLASFKNYQNVLHSVPVIDMSSMRSVCPVTGITIDRMAGDESINVWYAGKVQSVVSVRNIRARFGVYILRRSVRGGATERVYFERGVEPPKFYHEANYWLDDEATRKALGFVKLDAAHYPDSDWEQKDDTITLSDGSVVLREDALRVVTSDDEEDKFLFADAATKRNLKREGYISVGTKNKVKVLMHKDHGSLVELHNGRYASFAFSNIVKLHNGKYAHERQTTQIRLFGIPLRVVTGELFPVDGDLTSVRNWVFRDMPLTKMVRRVVGSYINSGIDDVRTSITTSILRRIRERLAANQVLGGVIPRPVRGTDGAVAALVTTTHHVFSTVSDIRDTAAFVNAKTDAEIAEVNGVHAVDAFRIWARCATMLLAEYDQLDAVIAEQYAEAHMQQVAVAADLLASLETAN